MDAIRLSRQYEFDVYPKRDVVLVRGQGARVWDDQGKEYIDCAAGVGVASVGHCNPAVVEAVNAQARTLITCPGTFHNDVRSKLCERLVNIAPSRLTRVFLCNSGTEAIEAALKFARRATGKTDFVCAMKGFHGRTFGAMSATFKREYKASFAPIVPGFHFAPFNNFEKLAECVTDSTAAVILEIVQGEGGIHVGDGEYFRAVRELCDRRGVLMIVDEVQTGFCRTGKMFACRHHGVEPDIMCVAKAIAGGLPMGAVLCGDAIEAPVGEHGSTFGGNPLCCAAALAAIDYMETHKLAEKAAEDGQYLLDRLREKPLAAVREIRGLGLMIGIELKSKVRPVVLELIEKGVIAPPAGATVLRLLPPLVISREQLDKAIHTITDVLGRDPASPAASD
jgi:acetylornithine/LysW-gamma-L-lysine aminotransferase